MKVFVSTYPFGIVDEQPIEIMKAAGIEVELNPYKRKITQAELAQHIKNIDVLIAGTEKIDESVLKHANKLKLIARVGIGLDGIDFDETSLRNIALTYTPDAVTHAVAELTMAHMLGLARDIIEIDSDLKTGKWTRKIGFEIRGKTIGLIGFGRVGQRVAELLQGFKCKILANDIAPDENIAGKYNVQFVSKKEIYRNADVISLHLPRTALTHNLIDAEVIKQLKKSSVLINTSRGGIVNEHDLYLALKEEVIKGAAIDVFEQEPYQGPLTNLSNVVLTAHSGSCSREARYLMELGAAEEAVSFKDGISFDNPVPEDLIQMEKSIEIGSASLEWNEVYDNSITIESPEYQVYRKKWIQYPVYRIVNKLPLNIDIELVKNDPEAFTNDSLITYLNSSSSKKSIYMDDHDFGILLSKLPEVTQEMAIKLGGRGSSLGHPSLIRYLKRLSKFNFVETIIGGDLLQFIDLDVKTIHALVDNKVDVLNVYCPLSGFDLVPLDNFVKLLRYRLKKMEGTPKIRIIGYEREEGQLSSTEEFLRFWRHWADVISWPANQDVTRKTNKHFWDFNRLWQRMSICVDGTLLANSNDISENFILGNLKNTSIEEAWTGRSMQTLRDYFSNLNKTSEFTDQVYSCWGELPPNE